MMCMMCMMHALQHVRHTLSQAEITLNMKEYVFQLQALKLRKRHKMCPCLVTGGPGAPWLLASNE